MTTFTREDLFKILHLGECIVKFTKINGEMRSMPCTLNESLIPSSPIHISNSDNPIDFPTPKQEKKINPDVISVWCLDKKEWRSFRIANVISIESKND